MSWPNLGHVVKLVASQGLFAKNGVRRNDAEGGEFLQIRGGTAIRKEDVVLVGRAPRRGIGEQYESG